MYISIEYLEFLLNKIKDLKCDDIFINFECIICINYVEKKIIVIGGKSCCVDIIDYFINSNDVKDKLNCGSIKYKDIMTINQFIHLFRDKFKYFCYE